MVNEDFTKPLKFHWFVYIIIELSAPEYLYTNLRMYLLDVLDC